MKQTEKSTKEIVILLSNKENLVNSFTALCHAHYKANTDVSLFKKQGWVLKKAVGDFVQRFVDGGELPDCLFDGSADAYFKKPYKERLEIRITESLKKKLVDKIQETLGIGISELVREYIVQCVIKNKLL